MLSGSRMLKAGERGLSQLLRRVLASTPPPTHGGHKRVLAAAASTASSPSRFNAGIAFTLIALLVCLEFSC